MLCVIKGDLVRTKIDHCVINEANIATSGENKNSVIAKNMSQQTNKTKTKTTKKNPVQT